MPRKRLLFKSLAVFLLPLAFANAGTIPAGTTIVVKTTSAISSHEKPGRTFKATLDHDVGGLKAGTIFLGDVEASRGSHSSEPLALNLTNVVVNGKKIPVKTTDAFRPQAKAKHARQSRASFSVGESVFQPGMKMEFKLAQAVNL